MRDVGVRRQQNGDRLYGASSSSLVGRIRMTKIGAIGGANQSTVDVSVVRVRNSDNKMAATVENNVLRVWREL